MIAVRTLYAIGDVVNFVEQTLEVRRLLILSGPTLTYITSRKSVSQHTVKADTWTDGVKNPSVVSCTVFARHMGQRPVMGHLPVLVARNTRAPSRGSPPVP